MLANSDSIHWLLYVSTVSTTKIARACLMDRKLIHALRTKASDIMDLGLGQAIRLSTYAETIKGAAYYTDRRWVIREEDQLHLYEYEELTDLPSHAELLLEVGVTAEIADFEKLKHIRQKNPDVAIQNPKTANQLYN